MTRQGWVSEVAEEIVKLMDHRVEAVIETMDLPPGVQEFGNRREAAAYFSRLSPEQKMAIIQEKGFEPVMEMITGEKATYV